MGPVSVLRKPKVDLQLLGEDGRLPLLPASTFDAINLDELRVWCLGAGRYALPTTETVGWLQQEIGGRFAVEIGAGCGDLAHYLGILATDNHMQEIPSVRAEYEAMRQPVIAYGSNVQRLDAAATMRKYNPQVVVACWVTQWIDPDGPPKQGNPYGVKEEEIIASGATYIFIGNTHVHGEKRILRLPHKEYALPFLRSRSADQGANRIWVWN